MSPMPSMQQNNQFASGNKVLSASASEFIPQNFKMYSELNRTTPSSAVLEVQKAIKALINAPGEFYEVMLPLVSELGRLIHSLYLLKGVVQEIFETSVNQSEFRYSGARMCSYLSQHLTLRPENGSFLTELVLRCMNEYDTVTTAGGYQSLFHLMGFIYFTGELLVCMKDVDEIRKKFPDRLEDLLMTLISHQSPRAFQCVILSLKLTGAILDELVPHIEELYFEIHRYIGDSNIPESVQVQIKALLGLRSRGWEKNSGETENCDEAEEIGNPFIYEDPEQEAYVDSVEAVYYDQNGAYLSEESELFENLRIGDGEDVQYLENGQPMDPETAEAFENFIQQLPGTQDDIPAEEMSIASGGFYAGPDGMQWQVDAWKPSPSPFVGSSANYGLPAPMSEVYNQNFYPYYSPLDNSNAGLLQLQPNGPSVVPPGAVQPPMVVRPQIPYMGSVPLHGSDSVYPPATPTADVQFVRPQLPSNGVLPPFSQHQFSR